MDDNTTLRAEFTIGDHTVTALRPTAEQAFVLQLTRQSRSTAEGVRTAKRLMRILELILGEDQWYDVIEDGLMTGTISVSQLMELANSIFRHDWDAETVDVTTVSDPQSVRVDVMTGAKTVVAATLGDDAVNRYEDEIADALAAGE